MKVIEVVAAIVQHEGKTLCVQRGPNVREYISYKYEFPGGKIEAGESQEQALVRELQEELSLQVYDLQFFMKVEHAYPDFFLIMHSYLCKSNTRQVHLSEHVNYQWLDPKEMQELDWAAADIPMVEKLSRS